MALLLALLCVAPAPASHPQRYEAEITAAVADVARVWPVPPALVRAIIRQESAFNPRAVSRVGARGLMQLMPETAVKVGVDPRSLFTPAANILAGVRLLAALLSYYAGDVVSALVAYNSGPKAPTVVPTNGETPGYVIRVLAFWRQYAAELAPFSPVAVPGTPLPPKSKPGSSRHRGGVGQVEPIGPR